MKRSTPRFQFRICIRAAIIGLLIAGFLVTGMVRPVAARDFALGDIPLDKETYEKYIKRLPSDRLDRLEALPTSYDARAAGIVTPAKDQGSCGSCWAFACVGSFESHLLKKYGVGPTDLSEQQLLRCNTYGYDCIYGGSSDAALYWETTGPVTESCYPYTATDGTCSYSCAEMAYRVTDWHTVSRTASSFKDSCYNEGPGYWRFTVYYDFYDFWDNGKNGDVYVNVYTKENDPVGGHAVLLIGWDDAKGAYLCKNSWGEKGGPNGDGTFWIAYSGHAHDLWFGMANFDITGGIAECPDCPANGVITNATYRAGTTCSCWNGTSITLGENVTVEDGATVTFIAPIITVQPGFHAEPGALVRMQQ